jgi:hypothetical protein
MTLTYQRRRFQWAGKRITQRQMERALRLREETKTPITQMVTEALELYLEREELRLAEARQVGAAYEDGTISHRSL